MTSNDPSNAVERALAEAVRLNEHAKTALTGKDRGLLSCARRGKLRSLHTSTSE